MKTIDLINTLKQGRPMTEKLMKIIIIHLEMLMQVQKNLEYYVSENQRLEDLLAKKEG